MDIWMVGRKKDDIKVKVNKLIRFKVKMVNDIQMIYFMWMQINCKITHSNICSIKEKRPIEL